MNKYTHKNGVTIERLENGTFVSTNPSSGHGLCRSNDGFNWVRADGKCSDTLRGTADARAAWYGWAAQSSNPASKKPVTYTGPVKDWPDGIYKSPNSVFVVAVQGGRGLLRHRAEKTWEMCNEVGYKYTRVGAFDPSVLFEGGA
jgi:hypothetical protein